MGSPETGRSCVKEWSRRWDSNPQPAVYKLASVSPLASAESTITHNRAPSVASLTAAVRARCYQRCYHTPTRFTWALGPRRSPAGSAPYRRTTCP